MGLLIDYLREHNDWWRENYWKINIVVDIIFFACLIGLMWYVVQYDCADVYEKCRLMCSHCNPNITIEGIKGHMVNESSVIISQ